MIGFFRRIRKKLADDNKPMKYMRYAIGEIVLVMVGILLALQVNNWNVSRLDRITELKHLKSIANEIEQNLKRNQSLINSRLQRKIDALKLAKNFCENEIIVKDTLNFLTEVTYGGVFSGGHQFGERSAYDELINTGNLQLIRKDSIKNAIASYYSYLNATSERATIHASRFSSYTSELRPFNTKNSNYISKFDQVEMMGSFKSSEFRRMVDLELSYAYKIRDYMKNVKSNGMQTINLIKEELQDK